MRNTAMATILEKVRMTIAGLSDEQLVAAIEDDPLLVEENLDSMIDVRQMVARELSSRHPKRWEKFTSTPGGVDFKQIMLTDTKLAA